MREDLAKKVIPTNEILQIGMHNEIVFRYLQLWERGHLTYEEALRGMVYYLDKKNKGMMDMMLKHFEQCTTTEHK